MPDVKHVSDRNGKYVPIDDKNSDPAFIAFYEKSSVSPGAEERFRVVRDKMLRLREELGRNADSLSVLNVGCGAGTECQGNFEQIPRDPVLPPNARPSVAGYPGSETQGADDIRQSLMPDE